jgi:serine/threonine protein kinase
MTAPGDDSTLSATRHGGLPAGYRLREFAIQRVLGEGGFGVVYEAIDTKLERRVAIKEYMPAALATRDTDYSVHPRSSAGQQEAFVAGLRSFVNEARLLARFEHPALVKVYQFWEEKGTAYMVMPFYSAPTLKQWLRDRMPLPEEWLLRFLGAMMDALQALHRENCLHRDVAPDNVLVINDAAPLLLDFGAARRVIGDLTHALTVILKPGFAPIEQYAESAALKQGPWTDVYALAAVGYFAILGKAPPAAVSRMVSDEMVPLRNAAAGRYSARLLAALDFALAVKPAERPQSIAQLRELLFGGAPGDDERTRLAPAALSPAPAALHSTFKPEADDERTRVLTGAPVARSSAPTVPLGSVPAERRVPTEPAAGAAPPQARPARLGALAWAGSFAAFGAAIVFGLAWWFNRAPGPAASAPPPLATGTAEAPAPLPTAPAPAPAPVVEVAIAPSPAPPKTAAPPPPVKPAEPVAKAAPAPAAKKVERAPAVEKPKAPPRPSEAEKRPAPQLAEATKPAPEKKAVPAEPAPAPAAAPALRAPEGPPPLEVTDAGIVALQVPGTVKADDKEPLFAAFTCCNLHFSGDWVSDLNYASQERIPAGTPIKIVDYGRWRIITEIGGRRIRIGLDYGRRQETLAQYARKLTVDRDLRFRIASFPPLVQDAIAAGKLLPGMSKEQVVMAVGFPARHETPSVADTRWKLWYSSRVPYFVAFDERGRVQEIEIDPAQRANVVYAPK